MTFLDLSIIITAVNDIKIKKCLESIDENLEIIVVLDCATENVKKIVESFKKTKTIEICERNLGLSRDLAIRKSRYDKILLMDSDCTFEKRCIEKVYKNLKKFEIVKCNVIFDYTNPIGKIISKFREYTTSDQINTFAPGIAFDKNISKKIGGYYFDKDIHWVEDSELNNRVKKADIKIKFLSEAKIHHSPLSLQQDLRSAFRYGCGKRIGVEKRIMSGVGSFLKFVPDIIHKKGLLTGLYAILWSAFYCSGYFLQAILDIYHIKNKIKKGE